LGQTHFYARIYALFMSLTTITIKTGKTIVWTNKDATPHSVSFTDETILDSVVKAGAQVSATFATPGTYRYKDKFSGSQGIIIVE